MPAPGHEVDDLDLGRPPRPPHPRPGARLLAAAAVGLVAVGVVVALLARPDHGQPAPVAGSTPSAGFAGGPVLDLTGGRDQLTVPGGAMFGGAAMNVALTPDDALIAAVRTTVPSFTDVHGGRVTDPAIHYGIYLQGTYTAGDGSAVDLTLYTARAPETPASVVVTVDRVTVDGVDRIRTDGSVYTGTGWWVHGTATSPLGPQLTDQRELLKTLLADPRLVA